MADGRGFEPRVPFGTHAFQACTIDRSVTHPFGNNKSKVQAPEQFVERQLNADVKLTEIRIFGAHRIETHFLNDRLDLKRVAREQRHAPLRVVQAGRSRNQLFYFAGKLTSHARMTFH